MKKRLISVALICIMLTGVFAAFSGISAVSYSGNNWMGQISSSKSLGQISIPGTHESCARTEQISGTAKCQELSLSNQLNSGVRYIDIRCRRYDNAFTIHHGVVYQNMNFQDVLNYCYSFLNQNPTETIIMSVKDEYDAEDSDMSFEEIFYDYIDGDYDKWYLGTTIPTLGAVRGKIVLFRRFATSSNTNAGIKANSGWSDNSADFTITGGGKILRIQDHYSVSSASTKWNDITTFYGYCTPTTNTLYINYSSGYTSFLGIPRIRNVSDYVNERLESYFNGRTGFYGITAMDFVTSQLCLKIIATNFS